LCKNKHLELGKLIFVASLLCFCRFPGGVLGGLFLRPGLFDLGFLLSNEKIFESGELGFFGGLARYFCGLFLFLVLV